jgi:hypothetical protein
MLGRSETAAVDDALFEEVAKPIARRFGVTAAAMRIRLENTRAAASADLTGV